jgi:hypothetical protein
MNENEFLGVIKNLRGNYGYNQEELLQMSRIIMVLRVLESYKNNPNTQHLMVARGSSYREVIRILNMFRNQMSDLKFPNLPPDEMFPIQVIEECELKDFYRDGTLVFKDNSVTDM